MKKMTIKSWAIDDRPREKLIAKGARSLSTAELIAILISSGNKQESAVDLSKRVLLSANNNIHELAKFSLQKLTSFRVIGPAKAISIITALELGNRRQLENFTATPKITGSKDVYNTMQPLLGCLLYTSPSPRD